MEINLGKALKIKNRLAGKLQDIQQTIQHYNSVLEGNYNKINVIELDEKRQNISDALVFIKTTIAGSNKNIYNAMYQMQEKKSTITFLKMLNTRDGVEASYDGINVKYVASISKPQVDRRVSVLEREIDALQDTIDNYNATFKIEIEKNILDLL